TGRPNVAGGFHGAVIFVLDCLDKSAAWINSHIVGELTSVRDFLLDSFGGIHRGVAKSSQHASDAVTHSLSGGAANLRVVLADQSAGLFTDIAQPFSGRFAIVFGGLLYALAKFGVGVKGCDGGVNFRKLAITGSLGVGS